MSPSKNLEKAFKEAQERLVPVPQYGLNSYEKKPLFPSAKLIIQAETHELMQIVRDSAFYPNDIVDDAKSLLKERLHPSGIYSEKPDISDTSKDSIIEGLRGRNNSQASEIDRLRAELQKQSKEIETLQWQNQRQSDEIGRQRQALNALKKTRSTSQTVFEWNAKHCARIAELEKESEGRLKAILQLREDARKSPYNAMAYKASQTRIAELEKYCLDWKKQNDTLAAELENIRQALKPCSGKVSTNPGEHIHTAVERVVNGYNELAQQPYLSAKEKADLENQITNLNHTVMRLTKELGVQKTDLEGKMREREDEILDLQSRLKRFQSDRRSAPPALPMGQDIWATPRYR